MTRKKKSTSMGLAKEKKIDGEIRKKIFTTARIRRSVMNQFEWICKRDNLDLTTQLSSVAKEWANKRYKEIAPKSLDDMFPD